MSTVTDSQANFIKETFYSSKTFSSNTSDIPQHPFISTGTISLERGGQGNASSIRGNRVQRCKRTENSTKKTCKGVSSVSSVSSKALKYLKYSKYLKQYLKGKNRGIESLYTIYLNTCNTCNLLPTSPFPLLQVNPTSLRGDNK